MNNIIDFNRYKKNKEKDILLSMGLTHSEASMALQWILQDTGSPKRVEEEEYNNLLGNNFTEVIYD